MAKLALGLCCITLLLLAGCTPEPLKSSGLKRVATEFWAKVKSSGIQGARLYTTKNSQALIDGGMKLYLFGNYKIGKEIISGDTATVILIDTDSADKKQFDTVLVREAGRWKIALLKTVKNILLSMKQ